MFTNLFTFVSFVAIMLSLRKTIVVSGSYSYVKLHNSFAFQQIEHRSVYKLYPLRIQRASTFGRLSLEGRPLVNVYLVTHV